MAAGILIAGTIASSLLFIRAEYRGPDWQIYLFKPLTTFLIILFGLLVDSASSQYRAWILLGLVFSLAGDVFLMLPADRFLPGLVCFLLAHLGYIRAFSRGLEDWNGIPILPLLVYGVLIYRYLASELGRMRVPVLVYMLVILVMSGAAWERWLNQGGAGPLLAAVGSVLFLISDSLLAVGRFRKVPDYSRALSLGSYFTAQLLIAMSVGGV